MSDTRKERFVIGKAPPPGSHMGAAYNALCEEGTKDDVLIAYARVMSRLVSVQKDLNLLREQYDKLRSDTSWDKDRTKWGA